MHHNGLIVGLESHAVGSERSEQSRNGSMSGPRAERLDSRIPVACQVTAMTVEYRMHQARADAAGIAHQQPPGPGERDSPCAAQRQTPLAFRSHSYGQDGGESAG
jgi:hypothetical protein